MARLTTRQVVVRGAVILVVLCVMAMISSFVVQVFGRVDGVEFSPHMVARREFTYLQVPLLNIQVWPIQRSTITGDLEKYLVNKKYVSVVNKGARWDLAAATSGTTANNSGDAGILVEYLDAVNQEQEKAWVEWSNDHPKFAKQFWPVVFSVAREEMYVFVPSLFDVAKRAATPNELSRMLAESLAESYSQVAEIELELGDDEMAVEFYSRAIGYAPKDSELLKRRAAIYEKLGDEEKANRDLTSAAELTSKEAAD
ncbi:MAG: hypothetical protein QGG36_21570 [Pirellulaceae bacterium]|jgi:tetratricopeptide (TPR) repeat protein|nr:hypothetical protein [Pirellulaceae bacterium]MDP7018409.1 hypothetical protein [Pirellulaceae bacterium]